MISYLGTVNSNITQMSSGNITTSLSALNLQQNDVVFAVYVSASDSSFGTISGWTLIQKIGVNDSYDVGIAVYVKIMGSTPDSSVTASSPGAYTAYQALSVIAFRGVDTSSLYDGTTSFTSGTNTSKPTPPAITLSNSNSVALVFAANGINSNNYYLSETYSPYSVSLGPRHYDEAFSLAFAYKTFSTPQTVTNGVWNTTTGSDTSANSWVAGILGLKEASLAPTVTTQAVSDIDKTTATGNGNITATGGANATRRGFCYKVGTTGDPTISDSVVYDDGSFGTGAYTKGITGLTPNTSYRVRAYAVNSAGTSYGSTVDFTTLKADESNFFQLF